MLIGVDIGGTNIRVAIGDGKGRIYKKIEDKTPLNGRFSVPKQIVSMINSITGGRKIAGIGIASFGPLDMERGLLIPRHHIEDDNIPLVPYIQKALGKKPILLNDCVAAVLAEKRIGSGKDIDNLVYVTISTGIGGGIIADGNLLLGKDGNAHEIGHVTVQKDGLKCGCGGAGHWEAYTAGRSLPRFASYILKKKMNVESGEIFKLARKGNKDMKRVVEEAGKINAIGLANVINSYDPELITLGGAVIVNNKEQIMKPILKNISQHAINRVPKVKLTSLGEDICLKGALVAASSKALHV